MEIYHGNPLSGFLILVDFLASKYRLFYNDVVVHFYSPVPHKQLYPPCSCNAHPEHLHPEEVSTPVKFVCPDYLGKPRRKRDRDVPPKG